ncbi:MAG: amidohydrolase family protein [Pelagibaca sp.]
MDFQQPQKHLSSAQLQAATAHPCSHALSRRSFFSLSAAAISTGLLLSSSPNRAKAQTGTVMSRRVLLRGGTIMTLDGVWTPFIGDVLIEDSRIREISSQISIEDAEIVDCTGKIVMPGFIDTHHHMWEGAFRSSGTDQMLHDYFLDKLVAVSPHLTPEDVYIANRLSALAALNAGITTTLDWSHIANSPAHTDAAIAALKDSGTRAVYAYAPSMNYQGAAPNPYPQDIFRLRREVFSSDDQLVTLALGAMGPEFAGRTPEEAVTNAMFEWDIARHPDIQARLSVHVGVGAGGATEPLKRLDAALKAVGKTGLSDDTTYIHCVRVTDEELGMIVDTGGAMSLAIPVSLMMGMGTPPVERLRNIAPDFRYSLSVDVPTNQGTDMFSKMKALFMLQRSLRTQADPEACLFTFFKDPAECRDGMITAREVLEAATVEGARANGLLDRTGTLSIGKQADIVILDARRIDVGPMNDPIGLVATAMDTSHVDSVMVAGEFRKRDGRLVDVDVDRVLSDAEASRDAVLSRL